MDYKNMKDSELASVMVDYINRVEHLQNLIASYLDTSKFNAIFSQQIKDLYKQLKTELCEDAHYLELVQNRSGSVLYKSAFIPSIREAVAFGFTTPVNHKIDQKMFNAVAEAYYRLTACYELNEWEKYTES